MKKILHIILITIISLTVISCSSSDDSKTTTSSVSFVAVGTSGTLLTSSDGTSWTSRTSGTSNGLQRVIYANSTFVTVGDSGTILTYHKPFRIILPYFVSPPRKMGLPFNGQKNKKIRGHETQCGRLTTTGNYRKFRTQNLS